MQDETAHRDPPATLYNADTVDALHQGAPSTREGFLPRGENVGRYVIHSPLGAGGMGVVYAAYDPELDRNVALKFLHPSARSGDVGRNMLVREAQALGKLSHPNVVGVYDVGTLNQHIWIAMEFIKGMTLKEWLAAGVRTWRDSLDVLLDAAEGVIAAHNAGLVHRDLKPDNVMIGDDRRVRVMDFGLAHGRLVLGGEDDLGLATTFPASGAPARPELEALKIRLTATGAVNGTPAYMSPEQWLGKDAGTFSDQFSWCLMAWEVLYGESPFEGDSIMAIAANVISGTRRPPPRKRMVPNWVRRLLERGLDSDPSRRWPSMDHIVRECRRRQSRSMLKTMALVIVGTIGLASFWAQANAVFGEDEPPVIPPRTESTSTLVLRVSPSDAIVSIERADDTCLGWLDDEKREREHCDRSVLTGKELRIAEDLPSGVYLVEFRRSERSPPHRRGVRMRGDDLAVSIHSPAQTSLSRLGKDTE